MPVRSFLIRDLLGINGDDVVGERDNRVTKCEITFLPALNTVKEENGNHSEGT